MCQPFGTNVTTVCRLSHAKAITGHNRPKLQKLFNEGGPLGGLNPVARLQTAGDLALRKEADGLGTKLANDNWIVVCIGYISLISWVDDVRYFEQQRRWIGTERSHLTACQSRTRGSRMNLCLSKSSRIL
jgi:hypothetical protein